MLESVVQLLWNKSEFAQECVFRHSVRLGHDQVVPIREAVEGILQEVLTAAIEGSLHTEQSNSEGILRRLRRIWNGSKVIDLLASGLDVRVSAILSLQLYIGKRHKLPHEGFTSSGQGFVFFVIEIEGRHLKVSQHPIIFSHFAQAVEQVMQTGEVQHHFDWF